MLKPPNQQTSIKTIPDYPYNENKMNVQHQTKTKMKIYFFTDLLNAIEISSGYQRISFLIMFYNVLKSIIKAPNRSLLTYCFCKVLSSVSFSRLWICPSPFSVMAEQNCKTLRYDRPAYLVVHPVLIFINLGLDKHIFRGSYGIGV